MVQVNQRVLKERILWRHCTPKGGVASLDQSEYVSLRTAIDKLTLNDSSVTVHCDSSIAGDGEWDSWVSLSALSCLFLLPLSSLSSVSSVKQVCLAGLNPGRGETEEPVWWKVSAGPQVSSCVAKCAYVHSCVLKVQQPTSTHCGQPHQLAWNGGLTINASYEALESGTLVSWTLYVSTRCLAAGEHAYRVKRVFLKSVILEFN